MITFSKVKENIIDSFRSMKVFQFGAKTADVASSFGDDSAPLKNMTAIFADTSNIGEPVIIGYLNKNQIATEGEKRIFSVDPATGNLSFAIHLRTDGTCEIGGNIDFMVRYSALETAFNQLKNDFNTHNHTTTATVGDSAIPGVITPPTTTSNADISGAKIEEIKTI